MSQITSEQKLRLVHAIREQNKHNRSTMRDRENILFGTSLPSVASGSDYDAEEHYAMDAGIPQAPTGAFVSARLRLFLALSLLAGFIFMDFTKTSVMGIDSSYIEQKMEEDFLVNIFDFINSFPYTLESGTILQD